VASSNAANRPSTMCLSLVALIHGKRPTSPRLLLDLGALNPASIADDFGMEKAGGGWRNWPRAKTKPEEVAFQRCWPWPVPAIPMAVAILATAKALLDMTRNRMAPCSIGGAYRGPRTAAWRWPVRSGRLEAWTPCLAASAWSLCPPPTIPDRRDPGGGNPFQACKPCKAAANEPCVYTALRLPAC